MHDQLHHAFQSELSLNMSGSLKHHSCCFALLKMSENWRKSQDKRKAVVAVAIDLSKAFDSIDHSLLLAKFGSYGLSSSALQLCPLTWRFANRKLKFMGYVLVTETLKLVYLSVPFWGLFCLTSSLTIWTFSFLIIYVVKALRRWYYLLLLWYLPYCATVCCELWA